MNAASGGPRTLLIRGGLVLADSESMPAQADVLVEDDRISRVGPAMPVPPGAEVIDATEHLVLPGLVNAHTHAHNHLSRGALDGFPLEIWLQYLAARVSNRSPREIYLGAALGAIEMAKTGTTCACDMAHISPWPTDEALDAVAQAYADVGLRACIAPQVADLPMLQSQPELGSILPAALRAGLESRPAYPTSEVLGTMERFADRWHGKADGRIQIGVGPLIVNFCSRALLEGCAEIAQSHELVVQTHVSETRLEAASARRRYGRSPMAELASTGLVGPRTVVAHCVWLDDDEIDMVAAAGATIAHNPMSNLKLGSGIARVLDFRARGCRVALGTDGSGSSDDLNLFVAMRLAALVHRASETDWERWPSAQTVLGMATQHGARAAGFEGQVGRLEPGMKADVTVLSLSSTYFAPRNDLVAQIVFCDVGNLVSTVLVDGRPIVRDGKVTTVDESALLREATEAAARITSEAAEGAELARRFQPYLARVLREEARA